ncbi:MAG TPA: hypothetical protein VFF70_05125 [Anaerolineae bacterium]|nr:hypothetical protein [Anaerolineae bacterium]
MAEAPLPVPSKRKDRLKWIIPIALAMMVVCVGCFFILAIGLVSRGELTASAVGTDFRLWSINDRTQTGVALQRSYAVQRADKQCEQFDVTFLIWKPGLSIENKSYDDCG